MAREIRCGCKSSKPQYLSSSSQTTDPSGDLAREAGWVCVVLGGVLVFDLGQFKCTFNSFVTVVDFGVHDVYLDLARVFSKRVYVAPSSNGLWMILLCVLVIPLPGSGHRQIIASLSLDYDYILIIKRIVLKLKSVNIPEAPGT